MTALLWIALIVFVLWVLHRAALWAERRGWIFYLHRKASPGTASRAFMEVQSLLEPGSRHVIESRQEATEDEDDADDPVHPRARSRGARRTTLGSGDRESGVKRGET
jgi:hypothetical protein